MLPLSPAATAREALHRFKAERSCLALPVATHGEVQGVLTRARLIETLAKSGGNSSVLRAPVQDMLAQSALLLDRETVVQQAAELLVERGESRAAAGIITLREGRYGGMVSAIDVLGALARSATGQPGSQIQSAGADGFGPVDGDHLAFLGHEVRTPLVGMMGTLSLLEGCKLPADAAALVATLKTGARDLHGLVDDLIEIGRLKADRLELRPGHLDLESFANAVEAFWLPTASRKKLSFSVSVGENSPHRLRLDVSRLRQILNNLIGNALKFTDDGQVGVCFRAMRRESGGRLIISVTDTGCGVDEDLAQRLFQPFSRAQKGPALGRAGSGLGLSLVRGLAEGMDGTIRYEPNPGGGSVFTVDLATEIVGPVQTSEPAPVSRQRRLATFELGRVLIAEDHPVNRMVLERALTAAGWSVDQVTTGRQALRRAGERPYQAVLLDLRLPELHGLDAARELRKTSLGGGVPLVAVTADGDAATEAACLEAGFDLVLVKPINPQQLMASLCDLIMEKSQDAPRRAAG